MAYAVLVSLEQTIDQILNQNRYSTSPQEKQLIISLHKHVISLQVFLEDFTEKACNLEGQMRDAAAAAEDIIEQFMLDQVLSPNGPDLRMIESELKGVVEKIESLAAEAVEINNSIIIEDKKATDSSSISRVGKIEMVGFDDDLMEIKDRLTGGWPKLQFISIVGMGGIGKTTLAKNAYEDQLIQEHFHVLAWTTISQDYRAREILSSLLDSMKEFDPHRKVKICDESDDESESEPEASESIQDMEERVYKLLKGRRYVIVMDDIWSSKVLDDVRKLFPDDGNGSRIILTTRLCDVAAYADSSIPPYEMHLMDEDQSWNLLQHKLEIPPELETIGKEIATSCRGLPLAVVVIAGVLSTTSKIPALWKEIAKNISSVASKDERLEKILSLSYNHLPHRLKPCLLYMGFFPENYRIRASELIKLWVAEGFLKHPEGSRSLEEGAEACLEDLVRRNLILVTERKFNGKIKSCSLHDMVRDACLRLLQKEKNLRHVTSKCLKNIRNIPSMRSILCFDDIEFEGPLEHVRLLRILHVPMFKVTLSELLKLFHLRYIAIRCYDDIPSSISYFKNLQTLIIGEIYCELQPSIWEMQQLRHLIFNGPLPDPNTAACALENLQTLKHVYDKEYRAFLLRSIPNLKKLGLIYSPLSFYGGRYLNKYLVHLRQLEKLKMRCLRSVHSVLDVVLPSSLRECTICGWNLPRRFLNTVGMLPDLQVLKLVGCSLDPGSWVIGGDEFPQLKSLLIKDMEFETLDAEDGNVLPRLKCLRLHHCHLMGNIISEDIGEIPTLELIEVKECGQGVHDWARRVEEEQQNVGNDALQVRCIGLPIQDPG